MPREFGRPQRLADYLQKEVSRVIQMEMRDPRIGMVGVTDVEVSKDLMHAKIYVTAMGKDSAEMMAIPLQVLNSAAGFIRSQVAQGSSMRVIPNLRFYFDDSIARGSRLSHLIDQAIKADAEQHPDSHGDDLGSH